MTSACYRECQLVTYGLSPFNSLFETFGTCVVEKVPLIWGPQINLSCKTTGKRTKKPTFEEQCLKTSKSPGALLTLSCKILKKTTKNPTKITHLFPFFIKLINVLCVSYYLPGILLIVAGISPNKYNTICVCVCLCACARSHEYTCAHTCSHSSDEK